MRKGIGWITVSCEYTELSLRRDIFASKHHNSGLDISCGLPELKGDSPTGTMRLSTLGSLDHCHTIDQIGSHEQMLVGQGNIVFGVLIV